MANARDQRHLYGQHYTPHEVARLLAALAVRSTGDVVLDPSCGDGRLLAEALKLKRQLSNQHRSTGSIISDQVFGVERAASAVKAARRAGASVAVTDFFNVVPGARLNRSMTLPLEFDVVIGNPPYIRQELIGPRGKRKIEARLALDRVAAPDVFWPRWSGRSDIYVYFFAHSILFLKDQGRLVFLTASSWLDAAYGAALRDFLLSNFRVIAVIESAAESFFADASINTCITVLERESDSRAREGHLIRFVRFNRVLSQILADRSRTTSRSDPALDLAGNIETGPVAPVDESYRMRGVAQTDLLKTTANVQMLGASFERGWGKYLRADEIFFKIINRGNSRLQTLSKMASVRFGVKTGANEFFYVKEDPESAKGEPGKSKSNRQRAKSHGLLALADVASVRRGITTGANEFFYLSRADEKAATPSLHRTKHQGAEGWSLRQSLTEGGALQRKDGRRTRARGSHNGFTIVRDFVGELREIESEMLLPVVFSLKEIPEILLERVKARRMLFNCALTANELQGTGALEYIESGERAGYHRRPTCSNREPWYSVARKMKPAPLIFPSKVGERWLVALNRARVFEDKKLYGVFPDRRVSVLVLAALLNSTWARYYAEVTCRQMTGAQAIADIDVAVAEQIMLPDPRKLSPAITNGLEAAVLALSRRPVYSVFEEVKRPDRRRLDALALEAIGFSERSERELVLEELYEAVTALVRVRLAKSHPSEAQCL